MPVRSNFQAGEYFNCPRGFLCNKKECHVGIRKLDVHHLEIFSQCDENLQTVNQFVLPFVELFQLFSYLWVLVLDFIDLLTFITSCSLPSWPRSGFEF